MAERKVTCSKTALQQFNDAIEYIREDSPQNAGSVKERILKKIGDLAKGKSSIEKTRIKKTMMEITCISKY